MLLCKVVLGFQQRTEAEQEGVTTRPDQRGDHSWRGFTLQAKPSAAGVCPPGRMRFSGLIKLHSLFLSSLLVNKINNRLMEYKELAGCTAGSQRCFTALDSKHKS